MVSIPLSLAVGTVLLQHFGFTLNQLTIVGFVIALGLLIDDSTPNAWTLPNGYRWGAAGEIASRQESFGGFGGAILLATIGILTVLILEFKTFKSMMIVASVIPLGVIGGMVGASSVATRSVSPR